MPSTDPNAFKDFVAMLVGRGIISQVDGYGLMADIDKLRKEGATTGEYARKWMGVK